MKVRKLEKYKKEKRGTGKKDSDETKPGET